MRRTIPKFLGFSFARFRISSAGMCCIAWARTSGSKRAPSVLGISTAMESISTGYQYSYVSPAVLDISTATSTPNMALCEPRLTGHTRGQSRTLHSGSVGR
eukprot:1028109-Rhodomonas_salina.3